MSWFPEYPISLKDDTRKTAITKEDLELDETIKCLNELLNRNFTSSIEGQAEVENNSLKIRKSGKLIPVSNIPYKDNTTSKPNVLNALRWRKGGQIDVGVSADEWGPTSILRELPDDSGQVPVSNKGARLHSPWAIETLYGEGDDITDLLPCGKKTRVIYESGLQEILIKQIIEIINIAEQFEIIIYCEPSDPAGIVSLNVFKSDNLTAIPVDLFGMSIYPNFGAASLSSLNGIPLGTSSDAIFAHIIFQAGDAPNLLTCLLYSSNVLYQLSGEGIKDGALPIYLHSLYVSTGILNNVKIQIRHNVSG